MPYVFILDLNINSFKKETSRKRHLPYVGGGGGGLSLSILSTRPRIIKLVDLAFISLSCVNCFNDLSEIYRQSYYLVLLSIALVSFKFSTGDDGNADVFFTATAYQLFSVIATAYDLCSLLLLHMICVVYCDSI